MSSLHLLDPDNYEMCGRCSGTGKDYCSSCGGAGGHYETRYDYDYDGRSVSRSERVSCTSCSGTGYRSCRHCGGTGSARKYWRRKRSQPDVTEESVTDEEIASDSQERLSHSNLVASYYQAVAEANQAKAELLQEIWSSTSIAPSVKPDMCNWIDSLDPESPDTAEVVDAYLRQWQDHFPPYDRFVSLLQSFSGASFRASSYKWMSNNFGDG
jgi:hypothetical protein